MAPRLLLTLATACGFAAAAAAEESLPTLAEALAPAKIKVAAGAFKVRKFRKSESGSRHRTTVFADDGSSYLEAMVTEPLTRKDAEALMMAEQVVTFRLYQPRRTPYSDQLSKVDDCAKEFQPIKREVTMAGHKETALLATAGRTRAYGVCQRAEVTFTGASIGSYDEAAKRLLKLSFFYKAPGKMPEETFSGIEAALKELFPQ